MSEALYQAIKSGRVRLDDLNEDGKNALREYMGMSSSTPAADPASDFDPEVSDPSLQWKAAQYKPTLPNVNPEFAEKHPTLNRALEVASSPIRKVMSSPFMERAGQTGAEIMTTVDNPEKATTGSRLADMAADLTGGLMGFTANPAGGIQSAGAGLWGLSEKGVEAGMRRLPQLSKLPAVAQTGLKLGATTVPYEAAMAAVNNREMSAGEMATSAGANALLGALPYGAGKLLGGKAPKAALPEMRLRVPEMAAAKVEPVPRATQPKGNLTREGSISAAKFTVPEKMAEVGDGTKVRSLHVSAMESPINKPDTKAGLLMETYEGGAGTYKAITNKETVAEAQKMIADDMSGALRHARENSGTALSNTIELELVKKANAENRFDDAIDIINEVSQRSTTQGQAIQSLRLWGKMTAEGMQKFYVNTIKKVNNDLEKQVGKNAKKLVADPKILEDINARMGAISKMPEGRGKDIEIAKVLDTIAAQVPVPFLRKVGAIQTMAQLVNMKTATRNTFGNLGFAAMENVSGALGAGVDKGLSLLTGKRTKVLPSIGTQFKGAKQGWKHGLEDALLGIDTSGMATKFDLPRGKVFRKGLLGKAETAMNIELRATDRAFYQAAYEESLANQMRAAKTNVPTEEMKNTAHLDGLYRTFQDDNALSAFFSGLKKLMNDPAHVLGLAKGRPAREFGAGDFIIKYPRTPANLLMRGIDYSPAGFVKVLYEAAKPLAKREFNQKAFVEAFSRATVGSTALFGTGALLHKLGIITGRPEEDWDLAELNRQQGFGEYRINASALRRLMFGNGDTKPQSGDKIVEYSWFQPHAIPIAIGADIDANKGTEKGLVGPLLRALSTGINAFAEQPVVQGIETLFSGGYGDYSTGLVKVLENVPSSFVPTLLSQVRQLVDNQRRETYDPAKGKEAINRVTAKVPGLAATLPKKYGTLGQPLGTYPSGNNNPFNVFLNPAFVNTYSPSPEVQRVQDIFEQTGATNQVPRVADKSITVSGKKFVLSGQERSEYQRLLGEYTQQGFEKMSKNLKPEDAAKKMQEIMTDANTKAKTEILKARGERVVKKGNGIAVK